MKATKQLIEAKNDFFKWMDDLNSMQQIAEMDGVAGFIKDNLNKNVSAEYNAGKTSAVIKTEVKGTQAPGVSDRLEKYDENIAVELIREPDNAYNSNNIAVRKSGEHLGNLDAELCNALSPLIDANAARIMGAKISHLEKKSQRSARAKKALLYVEIRIELAELKIDNSSGCIVCKLGGDQMRCWAQTLDVVYCDIPFEVTKLLFELYNIYHDEYKNAAENDCNLGYLGLDNLKGEVLWAREKMREEMDNGLDADLGIEADNEYGFFIKAAENITRYSAIRSYLETPEDEDWWSFMELIDNHAINSDHYYWLDYTRVSKAEWDNETMGGFNHWYDVAELYKDKLPFDLSDEGIVSIFGFECFEEFADLSYGC